MQNTVLYPDNTIDNALLVKANNMHMRLKEFNRGNYSFETGKAKHDIDFEFAELDRFQWIDGYAIQTG
jgi:Fe(3+) dicitrate transport protein